MKDNEFEDLMSSIGLDIDIDNEEIIELYDEMEADIVYEDNNKAWIKGIILVPIIAALISIFLFIVFISQVKIVPANVIGAEYTIGESSIVPDTYVAKNKDIIVGSKVIVGTKDNSFIGPIMKNYEIVEIKKINDLVISVSQPGTKDLRNVPIFQVLYVLENKEAIDKNNNKELDNTEIIDKNTVDDETIKD